MAVSCDCGLIDGVSGTQAEKRRASHCLFLPSASWKTDMETSYGNTERWDKSGKTTLPLEKNLPRPWQTSGIVPRVYLKTDEAGCLGSLFEGSVLRSCSRGLNPSMTGQFVCGGLQKSSVTEHIPSPDSFGMSLLSGTEMCFWQNHLDLKAKGSKSWTHRWNWSGGNRLRSQNNHRIHSLVNL